MQPRKNDVLLIGHCFAIPCYDSIKGP
jgi:hypothetical protein